MSVLESLRVYLKTFTLKSIVAEMERWRRAGQSCFRKLLNNAEAASAHRVASSTRSCPSPTVKLGEASSGDGPRRPNVALAQYRTLSQTTPLRPKANLRSSGPFSLRIVCSATLELLEDRVVPSTYSIVSNFNSTAIAPGNMIWFNSAASVSGVGALRPRFT